MNKIFRASDLFTVPDGTKVASLFNSADIACNLHSGSNEGLSIAIGEIPPGAKSKIHVHPLVAQVTFVLEGTVSVCMKDSETSEKYKLELRKNEAVLTQKGTFFQLVNESEEICRLMYIVSPEFLFETAKGKVVYNDAIVLEEDWEELAGLNWNPPGLLNSDTADKARQKAFERRLSVRS
ncbi:MAG: cupin domain-containing protein [Syntrophomonadaceae bacterium]